MLRGVGLSHCKEGSRYRGDSLAEKRTRSKLSQRINSGPFRFLIPPRNVEGSYRDIPSGDVLPHQRHFSHRGSSSPVRIELAAYYIAEGSPADHVRDLDMHGPVSAVGGFVFFFSFSLRL